MKTLFSRRSTLNERLRRTYRNRRHRLGDFNDGQVVQCRLNPDDPVARWRFRVNLLAWQREGNCQKTHEDASHFAWTPFQKAARGGPAFAVLPRRLAIAHAHSGTAVLPMAVPGRFQ